jgi:uncharacterized protein YdaU (DUF1376 family)
MTDRPWYAHYESDYLGKTKWFHCAAQHGIYRAIVAALNTNGPIEDDEDELRAICRATPEEWANYWPKIRDRFLFKNEDGQWDHQRAADERRKAGKINKRLSNAGKAGAKARWEKKKAETSKPPPPPDDVPQAVALFNEMARRAKLPECQKLNDSRAKKIALRMKEAGGLEGWKVALEKVEASDFCRGKNDRGWTASIDFLCEPSKFTKLMEGFYDNRAGTNSKQHPASDERSRRREILEGVELGGVAAGGTPAEEPDAD